MPLMIVLALMALPFVEIWLMILVGQKIGVAWTILALFVLSASGAAVMRGAGTRAFREADETMRTGVPPHGGLLDTLMLMVGGILLLIPGFVTGAIGAVLALPFARPALRWVFVAWAERRIRRMATTPDGGPVVTLRGPGVPGQGAGETSAPGTPGAGRVVPGRIVDDDAAGGSGGARS